MSKILDVNAMLAVAMEIRLPTLNSHRARIEAMTEALAFDLARHLKIEMDRGAEFDVKTGMLSAAFGAKAPNQPCPPHVARRDPKGTWEYKPRPKPAGELPSLMAKPQKRGPATK